MRFRRALWSTVGGRLTEALRSLKAVGQSSHWVSGVTVGAVLCGDDMPCPI